jgi:hypothetical protein
VPRCPAGGRGGEAYLYGTSFATVRDVAATGKLCVMGMDAQGVAALQVGSRGGFGLASQHPISPPGSRRARAGHHTGPHNTARHGLPAQANSRIDGLYLYASTSSAAGLEQRLGQRPTGALLPSRCHALLQGLRPQAAGLLATLSPKPPDADADLAPPHAEAEATIARRLEWAAAQVARASGPGRELLHHLVDNVDDEELVGFGAGVGFRQAGDREVA